MGMELRSKIVSHANKLKKVEERAAAAVGVFDEEAQAHRDRFEDLVENVVRPAFEEFKILLRQVGRDAVIVSNMTHNPVQSICVVLVDRYLKLGIGKTLNLVNPKDDYTQRPNTKFYEVYRADDSIFVRERAVPHLDPVGTEIGYDDMIPQFLENDLARFFERAYPAAP
jgi:hypothetical protein